MTDSLRLGEIADAVWRRRLDDDVYLQLRNGIRIERLPRSDLQRAESDEAFAKQQLERLRTIDETALAPDERVTAAFLEDRLNGELQSTDFWWTLFPVTPYNVMGLGIYLQLVFQPYRFETAADGERYLQLLEDFARNIGDLHWKLEQQAERGWRVPRPALPAVRDTLAALDRQFDAALPVDSKRLEPLGEGAEPIRRQIRRAVEEKIGPAMARLQGFLGSDYEDRAPAVVGLAQFPGGETAYERFIRYHTTLDLDAQSIHDFGLEQVREITAAMQDVRSALGHDGGESEFHEYLESSGRLHAASAEDVERRYRDCVERIEPLIGDYFAVLPRAPYDVRRLDPAAEHGMSYGYYQPPTDNQPTGLYRFNGSGLETRSQLSAAAIIYHELVPGHHFHLARQKENESLPMIRREAIDITVFNEGWAEYASALAGEMGLYDDPYDCYGRLIHERFTAQRLVVDTGLNALGWSLEKGRDYMRRHTLESDTQVASETLRYSTDMPAQSLAYRIGFLKMTAFREQAAARHGRHFDLKTFHETILGAGALPLPVLEQHLNGMTNP